MLVIALLLLIKIDTWADNLMGVMQIGPGDGNKIAVSMNVGANHVDFSFDGAANSVDIHQAGNNNYVGFATLWGSPETWGGDLAWASNTIGVHQNCTAGSACVPTRLEFHIAGDFNTTSIVQGLDETLVSDGVEAGGSNILLDIHGRCNSIQLFQDNNYQALHKTDMYIYINSNNILVKYHEYGDIILYCLTYNCKNIVDINHLSAGVDHNASIILNRQYGVTVDLVQQGRTGQSYFLSQSCMQVGGCFLSVIQGQ
jgi:hypothetical protein